MPILGTLSTAAARAFGFLAAKLAVKFPYVAFQGALAGPAAPYPNQIYGSTSNTLATGIDIGWTFAVNGGTYGYECGIIVDGAIIATARALSNDGGSSWTNIQLSPSNFGGSSYTGAQSGTNEGLIAYNASSKLMGRMGTSNNPSPPYVNNVTFSLFNLVTKTVVSQTTLTGAGCERIVYSAPQNIFILSRDNYTTYYFNGTTGASLGTASGATSALPPGSHPTLGYLFYVYVAPNWTTRISTAADPCLSYTNLGSTNITTPSGQIGKPVWCPVNAKWYKAVCPSGGMQIYSSTNGASWTYLAQPLYWGYVCGAPVIKETSTGVLYLSGMGYTTGSGSPTYSGWASSTNGGATWSTAVYSAYSSVTTNLNP